MKERVWVNFKELRNRLRFDEVLRLYGVEVQAKGVQHHGPCPLPGHTGDRERRCFSANLGRGIFQCFGCGAKGNVLEFACLMEGADLKDGQAIRRVAVKLQQQFLPEGASGKHTPRAAAPAATSAAAKAADASPPADKPEKPRPDLPVAVNEPMDFELKGLDRSHEYFARSGISAATAECFGLGYCARGMLEGRIAIPLHDGHGRRIGYAGMLPDEAAACAENQLYRFPGRRERNGRILEFDRSAFLYNGHRLKAPLDDLIVVEWFPSVWWLHQCGFPHTVALMGSASMEVQADLVVDAVKSGGRVWVLPDCGKKGRDMAMMAFLTEVAPRRFVRWVDLGDDRRPAQMKPEELKSCFVL